ncbi:unnamed protein product [Rotaria sp. Silwood1]|nr:unnamed protein product [Rotaria sp. Silwood1]
MKTFFTIYSISVGYQIIFVAILGILFCLIGAVDIILFIIELFHGRSSVTHYDESHSGLKVENSLWPSSDHGKDVWVGLILVATELVATGGFDTILDAISTLVGCCANQRDKHQYSDEPDRIAVLPLRGYRLGIANIRPIEVF